MRGFVTFIKKEWMEYIRSYKLMILLLVFLAFGFMNPITAEYLPKLVGAFLPDGMVMNLPEPGILDSWTQFFKNVPQLGLVIMVITFGGLMSGEFTKGTLVPVLTKGLSRNVIVAAKLCASAMVWSICYFLSFGVSFLYSLMFWEHAAVPDLLPAVLYVWVFGIFMLSLLILGGILTKSFSGGILLAGIVFVLSMVMGMFRRIAEYSPARLVSDNMALLSGDLQVSDFTPALVTTLVLAAAAVCAGILVFRKKQL